MDHRYLPRHTGAVAATVAGEGWFRPAPPRQPVTYVPYDQTADAIPAVPAACCGSCSGRRSRTGWWLLPVLALLLSAVAYLGGMLGSHPSWPLGSASPAAATALAPAAPAAQPAPAAAVAPHVVRTTWRVVFRVTGHDPRGVVNVRYGSERHALGLDRARAPYTDSMKWRQRAGAYSISAQLYGPGHIRVSIYLRKIDHFSDGTRETGPDMLMAAGRTGYDGGYATARYASGH